MKKVALVTGAASGIGLATAKKLLETGVAVVGISRRAAMEDLGKAFAYVSGDVGCAADRQRFVAVALEQHGHIDILVNVAGVAPLAGNAGRV